MDRLHYLVIDTAQIYENEADIGQSIKESGVKREDLFITTKIWVENFSKEKLIPSLKESLEKLQTNYVDLTLIHWPAPGKGVSVQEMMNALLDAKKAGLTKQIGVSNFNIELTQQAINAIGKEEIATNQIELHPYLQNKKVVDFCKLNNIPITSYMTLAYGKVLEDPVVIDVASQREVTPAQLVLAWALQKGYSVIPSSTKRENLKSNLLAQKLVLTADEMLKIDALNCNQRLVDPEGLAPQWD